MRRTSRSILWVALLFLPARADAETGAGTQSVFASGFGNRALAMGSSFVAAGEDASALYWNPAGLARLHRAELQVAQSSGLGVGFQEAMLALGVPDWRWGTSALSLRTFGIDGLEQRDDRNRLIGNDLSDSELELALGYGRSVGTAVDVGGAVKVQRQSLAGFDAMGIGIDVGVRMFPGLLLRQESPWAEQLVWGFAIRNLVQPSLRLDGEGVADPSAIRSGLAWQGHLGRVGATVAEVGFEHVSGGGGEMRAGFEVRPSAVMAVRAGLDGGHLTAGTGFEWQRLGFNYAYLDNPVSAEHRIEFSYAFGRDVGESRAAAQLKEDQKLQVRLEEAYRQRRADQIAELLSRAQEARTAGRYDETLDALSTARALAPEDHRIQELEKIALKEKAAALMASGDLAGAALAYELVLEIAPADSQAVFGARVARAAGDARAARTDELRVRFARALDAFGEGQLSVARRELNALLAVAHADSDAIALLRRTELAIARGVVQSLDRADEAIRSGRATEALEFLKKAEDLDPSSPGIASRRAECMRLLRGQTAVRPSPKTSTGSTAPSATAGAPAKMNAGDIERLYRRGVVAQANGRVDEAIRCWEMIQSASPGYRGVDEFLTRQYLTRGMDAFAAGRLDEAIRDWEIVLRINPNDARARGYLDRAREQSLRRKQILGVIR